MALDPADQALLAVSKGGGGMWDESELYLLAGLVRCMMGAGEGRGGVQGGG